MTPATAMEVSTSLLVQLANPALRAFALAVAAALGLAACQVKSTSTRLFTWTAVLYGALAMPLLGWMLPPLPVPMPAFLQHGVEPTALNEVQASGSPVSIVQNGASEKTAPAKVGGHTSTSSSSTVSPAQPSTPPPARGAAPSFFRQSFWSSIRWQSVRWNAVAAGIYLTVAFFLIVRFFVGLVFARRLMRASRRIWEPRVALRLSSRAYALGLRFMPQALESELISVPVTMGALRSTILLPAAWREWDDAKLDAVVAHEVSHIARHDALTQRLSLLHRSIFWFSPLAWWLDRQLADLAEQASDEAALCCGADRNDYARTLLGFFEALQAAPGRVWWQGVSMAKAGQAEQRVERILAWRGAVTMGLKKSAAVLIVAFAIPVVYLAASVRSDNHASEPQHLHFAQDQTAAPRPAPGPKAEPNAPPEAAPASEATPSSEPPTSAEPALAPAPITGTAITGTISGGISTIPVPALAPVAPVPPMAPAPTGITVYPANAAMVPIHPVPPAGWRAQSGTSGSSSGRGYSYHYGYDDDQRFVIVSGKTDSFTMSGSSDDARHVEKLRKQITGDFIWFQRDEKSYIIRDQATIDRARKFWAPEEELGKKQEALGKQQEILGKQQEELGAKMELVQVKVPDMTAELDKLKAELKQLSSGATMEQVGRIQSEIGELQSKIGEIQSQAGEQQSKLGEQQGALGEKQGKLGEQQGELGRQQAELARQASLQMKELLDEAIKMGTAQPEP